MCSTRELVDEEVRGVPRYKHEAQDDRAREVLPAARVTERLPRWE